MDFGILISICGIFLAAVIQIYYHQVDRIIQRQQVALLRKIAYNSALENALIKERNDVG